MSRIKIEDLPVLEDLEVKETHGIFGGADMFIKFDGVDGEDEYKETTLIREESLSIGVGELKPWSDVESFEKDYTRG